jgi:phage-related baseplate assembly protein
MASVTFSLTDLFSTTTKARVYAKALEIATALGLPVTSWRAGDPTRSVYHVLAEEIEARDVTAASYAKSGFLDSATGEWLTILADQVFNVQREAASAAAGTIRLVNTEGGVYAWDVGDLVFRSSVNGKTYHNTTAGSLSTVSEETDVGFTADEEGADSSLAVDELDEIVTAMPGVEVLSSTAASANDEEDDIPLRARCRASTGALSPNGPADAYRFVATTSEFTGNTETTRVFVDADSTTGDVIVYCAGASGAVSGAALTAVENALARYSTPLTVTLDVQTVVEVPTDVTVTVRLSSAVGVAELTAEAAIQSAIEDAMNVYPVGGIEDVFFVDAVRSAAYSVYGLDNTLQVSVAAPASDVALADNEVVTPGTVSVSVVFS